MGFEGLVYKYNYIFGRKKSFKIMNQSLRALVG